MDGIGYKERQSGRGEVYSISYMGVSYDHRPSHPYNTGTEHVGFSPTRQSLLAPSARQREVFGESHKGCCILLRTACEADLHMDDSFNELIGRWGGGSRIERIRVLLAVRVPDTAFLRATASRMCRVCHVTPVLPQISIASQLPLVACR